MKNFKFNILTKVLLIFVLSIFCVLSYFNYPQADAYYYAAQGLDDFWKFQVEHYLTWSGRYVSTFILSSYPIIGDFYLTYKIIPILLMITFVVSLYLSIRINFKRELISNSEIFWISLTTLCIYITRIPSPAQGFYWLAGSVTYLMSSLILLVLISLMSYFNQTFNKQSRKMKIASLILITFLVITVAGSHEILAILIILYSIVGLAIGLLNRFPTIKLWAYILVLTSIFSLLEIFAPGGFNRASQIQIQNPSSLIDQLSILQQSAIAFGIYISQWISDPAFIAINIIAIPTIFILARRTVAEYKCSKSLPATILVTWLISLYLPFGLSYLSIQGIIPRVLNLVYFIFLVGWFICLLSWFSIEDIWQEKRLENISISRPFSIAAQVLLMINLLQQGNFQSALNDLSQIAPVYADEVEARQENINQQIIQGKENIIVPCLTSLPRTISDPEHEIASDASYWANSHWMIYYNNLKQGQIKSLKCITPAMNESQYLPSDFDSEVYLKLNPDVAKAGIDAKEHYLQFGRQENRKYK